MSLSYVLPFNIAEFAANTTVDDDAPPDSIVYDLIVPAASGLLYDPAMSSKSQYFKIVSDGKIVNKNSSI